MAKTKIEKVLKPYLKPFNFFIAFIILGLCLIALFTIIQGTKSRKTSKDKNKNSQIKIQNQNTTITIRDNGNVEYKTPNKLFYQKWDSNKIQAIFRYIEKEAQNPLNNSQGDYSISYLSQDSSHAFNLDENDELYSLVGPGDDNEDIRHLFFSSPSPSPSFSENGGGENGNNGENGDNESPPQNTPQEQDCILWGREINKKTAISNTVCLEEPE